MVAGKPGKPFNKQEREDGFLAFMLDKWAASERDDFFEKQAVRRKAAIKAADGDLRGMALVAINCPAFRNIYRSDPFAKARAYQLMENRILLPSDVVDGNTVGSV